MLVEIGYFTSATPLKWNGSNAPCPLNVLRAAFGNESRHGMDGGQSLIASAYRTIPFRFQVIEETPQNIRRKIANGKHVNGRPLLLACEWQEQDQSIAITSLSVL